MEGEAVPEQNVQKDKAIVKQATTPPAETKPQAGVSESEMKGMLSKVEVSLVLDTYDDIFSDFDPRPYNKRTLSEDFLVAARRFARDKDEGIELRLLIPKALHSTTSEDLIKQRLKEHFRRHYKASKKARIKYRQQAIMLVIAGVIIGMVDALLLSNLNLDTILSDAIGIIFTPASWFTIWTGFEHLVIPPEHLAVDEAFNKKFESAKITFTTY